MPWIEARPIDADDSERKLLPPDPKDERIAALEAALAALLKGEGLTVTSGDTFQCPRCFVESRRQPFPHKLECPVVMARDVLKG